MIYRFVIVVLMAGAILIGCSESDQENTAPEKKAVVVTVKTETVKEIDFPVIMRFGGNLRGDRQTTIPARVTTTVTEIPVKIGQSVKTGEMLVRLDPGGVQSQYRQADAVFRNAEKQWNKMKTLFEAGAISEMQMDGAETEYEVAKANFGSARKSIEIEAPFDGIVTDIHVRLGDEVAPGRPVVAVANVGSLRLLLDIAASQVGKLKDGQTVLVTSPTDSSVVMHGTVFSIADAANSATRSFEVECHFPSPMKGFAPGMYVTAEIETEMIASAMVVPSEALLYRSGKTMLYLVKDNKAVLTDVLELASAHGMSAVEGEIESGQKVVVVGHKNLTPGTAVREVGQ